MRKGFRFPLLFALLSCPACGPHRAPPPRQSYFGLPVSGALADAWRAGFNSCFNYDAISMRCRRQGVMLVGQGPYEAAVDLVGGDGSGGFDELTLWDDNDQEAVYKIGDALVRSGWRSCDTSKDERGDQEIYTRPGVPVRVSMDLSYWGKRRLRVIPNWNRKERVC